MPRKLLLSLLAAIYTCALTLDSALAQQGNGAMQSLENLRSALVISKPLAYKNLTIYPISVSKVKDNGHYLHLDRALKGSLNISEWGSGEVPRLRLRNRSGKKVFIMTGEIITGANQDRMSAQDVLVVAKSKTLSIKVYCVEQGRWVMQSQRFAGGGSAGTSKLRRSATMKHSQGKIWRDVAEKSRDSRVTSSTGTMQAIFSSPRIKRQVKSYQKTFQDLPQKTDNMVGFVAVTRGLISTADIFSNPRLFKNLWKKLLRTAAVDAVTQKEAHPGSPTLAQVQQFVDDGFAGQFKPIDNPDLGHEFLIEGQNGVCGSTLVNGSSVVHLALFSPERGDQPRELRPEFRRNKGKTYRLNKTKPKGKRFKKIPKGTQKMDPNSRVEGQEEAGSD